MAVSSSVFAIEPRLKTSSLYMEMLELAWKSDKPGDSGG
jgi:hypothetical protein